MGFAFFGAFLRTGTHFEEKNAKREAARSFNIAEKCVILQVMDGSERAKTRAIGIANGDNEYNPRGSYFLR